jgi:2-polyprenyl-3-methyl-5-hydroxy-6-metoxy-1,4-benzoquinol methylase
MYINTFFFAAQLNKLLKLKSTDRILDYGCGPGYFSDYFARLATEKPVIDGADINSTYVALCKKKYPDLLFFKITPDCSSNEKILKEQLSGKDFNYIVLLSIVQYFEGIKDLEKIVALVGAFLQPNGKLIIADVIDHKTSPVKDALSLFLKCLQQRKIKSFFKFIHYLFFSNYRTIVKDMPLLKVSDETLSAIAKSNNMDLVKVKGLTIHPSRNNYIFTKKIQ